MTAKGMENPLNLVPIDWLGAMSPQSSARWKGSDLAKAGYTGNSKDMEWSAEVGCEWSCTRKALIPW